MNNQALSNLASKDENQQHLEAEKPWVNRKKEGTPRLTLIKGKNVL